jgi:hypothetical protein
MPIVFEANSVRIIPEGSGVRVEFTDDTSNSSDHLVVCRWGQTDPHSEAAGPGPICVEFRQQERSAAGGIVRLVLKRHAIRVTLDRYTATDTGGDPEIKVRFRLGPKQLWELRIALRQLCKGQGCFINDTATGLALLKAILVGPPTPTSERLVTPTYCAVVGMVCGAYFGYQHSGIAGAILGGLGGVVPGALYGFVKGLEFRHLFKYK